MNSDAYLTTPAWRELMVEPVLGRDAAARAPVRAYLRDLEAVARAEGGSREALQVIASGRRLLGDASGITDADRRRLG